MIKSRRIKENNKASDDYDNGNDNDNGNADKAQDAMSFNFIGGVKFWVDLKWVCYTRT